MRIEIAPKMAIAIVALYFNSRGYCKRTVYTAS
jgi:hypothetical protein